MRAAAIHIDPFVSFVFADKIRPVHEDRPLKR
jgi:hypothetical protein